MDLLNLLFDLGFRGQGGELMRPAGMHFLDGISGVYKYKKILRELSSVLLISTSFVKRKRLT